MRKILFPLAAAVVLSLPAAAHATCVGVSTPIAPTTAPGHVCGSIYRFGYDGSNHIWRSGVKTNVKLCPKGSSSSSSSCKSVATTTQYDGYGTAYQNFTFPYMRQGASGYQDFDIYLWGYTSTSYWGSDSKPQGWTSLGPNGLDGIQWAVVPRPLPPTPVYPSGTNVPNAYLVRWKSGIDIDRRPYAATYEVWYKYWPFGGTEPSSWTLSAGNLGCQDNGSGPDANNECSTYVPGPQLPGNWKWYVVANLNMGSAVSYPNTILSTKSSEMSFVQPY